MLECAEGFHEYRESLPSHIPYDVATSFGLSSFFGFLLSDSFSRAAKSGLIGATAALIEGISVPLFAHWFKSDEDERPFSESTWKKNFQIMTVLIVHEMVIGTIFKTTEYLLALSILVNWLFVTILCHAVPDMFSSYQEAGCYIGRLSIPYSSRGSN